MKVARPNACPPAGPQHGAALIVTLLVLVLLVVIVTGFLSTTRVEQMATRNYSYQSAAEQMAQLATKQAMAVLRSNYNTATSSIAFATQPGAIIVFAGTNVAPRTLTNYSTTTIAGATNLNTLTTNGWITGNTNQAITVGLVNVTSSTGGLLGRYAFYIDDESSKLPLNAAVKSRDTLNPVFPRPYSVDAGGFGPSNASQFASVVSGISDNPKSIANWTFFFTPEQARKVIGLDATNIPTLSSSRETNAAYSTNTPWGTSKVFINDTTAVPFNDAGVLQIAAALTNSKLTNIFGKHFGDKYGAKNIRQLAANILQLRDVNVTDPQNFYTTNRLLGSAGLNNSAFPAPTSGELKKTNGIPSSFLGYVPFPMLEEMSVSYVYGWTAPSLMTVRFVVECKLFNPFSENFNLPGSGIFAQIDKAVFPVFYPNNPGEPIGNRYRGPFGTAPAKTTWPYNDPVADSDPWGDGGGTYNSLSPNNGVVVVPIGTIPARSHATRYFTFDVKFDEGNPTAVADSYFSSYVILDQIRILANTNDVASVRDWASGYDFFNVLAGSAAGPAQIEIKKPAGPAGNPEGTVIEGGAVLDPALAPPATQKLAKLDPRMKPCLDVSLPYQTASPGRAWTNMSYAAALPTASFFTNASIPADPSFATSALNALYDTNFPPFLNISPKGGSNVPTYFSVSDFGKVFTGIPWRRLRLQPQPAQERGAGMIPDWVILDIFDVSTNTTAVTTVNPNAYLSTSNGVVNRTPTGLLSQLGVLLTNTITQLGDPAVPTNSPITQSNTYITYAAASITTIKTISSNAANVSAAASWSTNSGWQARRTALNFPTNALLLPSEITEIKEMADFVDPAINRSKVNEQRLGTLFPGLQTKSRFFTIYAVGEAFEGTNANSPVASQRLLRTLVKVETTNTSSLPVIDIIQQIVPQN